MARGQRCRRSGPGAHQRTGPRWPSRARSWGQLYEDGTEFAAEVRHFSEELVEIRFDVHESLQRGATRLRHEEALRDCATRLRYEEAL